MAEKQRKNINQICFYLKQHLFLPEISITTQILLHYYHNHLAALIVAPTVSFYFAWL